jgi:alkylation response protein AidB-like acyl-CoA dehydrogenase
MDVMGEEAEIADGFPYQLKRLQRMFLFARSETIYGGSNQIQRNQIAERALGLPREARPA